MHITLTGNLGSGKSTICKILESDYGFEIYSTGKVQRRLAAEFGISVLEMNQKMCSDHKFDNMIDDTTTRISRENPDKKIVFDSRLAWNFVEKSFKVFLSVSLDEAAKRVYADHDRGTVEKYTSVQDARAQLKARAENENQRYKDIYQIEYFNFSNYNLILDSTYVKPDLAAHIIMQEAMKHEYPLDKTKILISPKRLGFTGDAIKNTSDNYYADGLVTICKTENDYAISDGFAIVENAAKEGIPFVQAALCP